MCLIEHLANLLLVVCLPTPHVWQKRKTYIASKGGVFERLCFISDVSGWFSIRLSLCLSFHSNLTWRMFIHLISYNSYTTNENSPSVLNQLNIYQCSALLHNNLFFSTFISTLLHMHTNWLLSSMPTYIKLCTPPRTYLRAQTNFVHIYMYLS